jgi:hypothetical protein
MPVDGRWDLTQCLKADSHTACRVHAVPMPCPCCAHAVPMPCPCRAHAVPMPFPCHALPLRVYKVFFTFDLHSGAVSDSQLSCHAHATPMLCSDHAVLLKATAQHGRPETACRLPASVRLLPATTRSSTDIVIKSIPILLTTIHTYDCKDW